MKFKTVILKLISKAGTSAYSILGVKPSNWTLILKLFHKGDQLKIHLTNLIFINIGYEP